VSSPATIMPEVDPCNAGFPLNRALSFSRGRACARQARGMAVDQPVGLSQARLASATKD
jgi:hypothetical protein